MMKLRNFRLSVLEMMAIVVALEGTETTEITEITETTEITENGEIVLKEMMMTEMTVVNVEGIKEDNADKITDVGKTGDKNLADITNSYTKTIPKKMIIGKDRGRTVEEGKETKGVIARSSRGSREGGVTQVIMVVAPEETTDKTITEATATIATTVVAIATTKTATTMTMTTENQEDNAVEEEAVTKAVVEDATNL